VSQLDEWMKNQFDKYQWQPSDKEIDVDFVIAWNGSEMVGRSAVVTREVLLDDKPLVIMGLAGVTVKDGYRNQGLSTKMLDLSMQQVKNNRPDFCILLCEKSLERMYAKLGFRAIPGKTRSLRSQMAYCTSISRTLELPWYTRKMARSVLVGF